MASFRDSTGRDWYVELTFADIKRIRRRTGLDLMGLSDADESGKKLIDRIRDDIELALNLVYAAIEPEAQRLGVSDEDFGRSLDGPAAGAAIIAMWDAVADFFQGLRPSHAEGARQVIALRKAATALLTMLEEAQLPMPSGAQPTGQAAPAA